MIMRNILIILLIYKFEGVKTQEDLCRPIPFPMDISFNEKSSRGSTIFTGDKTNFTTQKWNITESYPLVSLEFINQTYRLVLLKIVDLDVTNTFDVCNSGLQQFTQRVSCYSFGTPDDKNIRFQVNPINEHPPDVVMSDPIQIQEGEMPTPIFIKPMLNLFKDRDCPKEQPIISMSKTTGETDVSEFFTINKTTGFLYQIKNFDFEETSIQCNLGKTGGVLNITAKDGPHSVSSILYVTFVDVDDSPPVFVRSECSTTCYSCPVSDISVTIHHFDQGIIKTEPSSIKALDPDTFPSNITYSLKVYPPKYKDNIEFENGSFFLSQSFANFNEASNFSVKILLRATGHNGEHSDNFTLTIYVMVPQTTTPEPTGFLYQIKNFDYEETSTQCNLGKTGGVINITATGIMKTLPGSIKALDPEAYQSYIAYSFDVFPEKYKDNVRLEKGNFILSQSFAISTNCSKSSDFSVRILLRASEGNSQTSDNFTLTMYVTKCTNMEEMTSQEIAKFCQKTPDESESSKNIAVIVLSISTGVLLTIVVVFVFYKMWSARTKSESPNQGYEEAERNNENKENIYATITL